jgi:DNA-binding MarR family transcriptional regulator
VKALEDAGLAARTPDTTDRRASILDLTEEGREVLTSTRLHRRSRLFEVMSDWPLEDRTEFGRLLEQFNASVDKLADENPG